MEDWSWAGFAGDVDDPVDVLPVRSADAGGSECFEVSACSLTDSDFCNASLTLRAASPERDMGATDSASTDGNSTVAAREREMVCATAVDDERGEPGAALMLSDSIDVERFEAPSLGSPGSPGCSLTTIFDSPLSEQTQAMASPLSMRTASPTKAMASQQVTPTMAFSGSATKRTSDLVCDLRSSENQTSQASKRAVQLYNEIDQLEKKLHRHCSNGSSHSVSQSNNPLMADNVVFAKAATLASPLCLTAMSSSPVTAFGQQSMSMPSSLRSSCDTTVPPGSSAASLAYDAFDAFSTMSREADLASEGSCAQSSNGLPDRKVLERRKAEALKKLKQRHTPAAPGRWPECPSSARGSRQAKAAGPARRISCSSAHSATVIPAANAGPLRSDGTVASARAALSWTPSLSVADVRAQDASVGSPGVPGIVANGAKVPVGAATQRSPRVLSASALPSCPLSPQGAATPSPCMAPLHMRHSLSPRGSTMRCMVLAPPMASRMACAVGTAAFRSSDSPSSPSKWQPTIGLGPSRVVRASSGTPPACDESWTCSRTPPCTRQSSAPPFLARVAPSHGTPSGVALMHRTPSREPRGISDAETRTILQLKEELERTKSEIRTSLANATQVQSIFAEEMNQCAASVSELTELFREEMHLCRLTLGSQGAHPQKVADALGSSAGSSSVSFQEMRFEVGCESDRSGSSSSPALSRSPAGRSLNSSSSASARLSPGRLGGERGLMDSVPTKTLGVVREAPMTISVFPPSHNSPASMSTRPTPATSPTPSTTRLCQSPAFSARHSPAISTRSEAMTPSGSARMLHNNLVVPLQPIMQPMKRHLGRIFGDRSLSPVSCQPGSSARGGSSATAAKGISMSPPAGCANGQPPACGFLA